MDCRQRGMTLIDTVVAVGLLLVVFVGITKSFQLGISAVAMSRDRATAVSLASDQIEEFSSKLYSDVVVPNGGAGGTSTSETITRNNVTFYRYTIVYYKDDTYDGISPSDTKPNDYKAVKVKVLWTPRDGNLRDVALVTRLEPLNGME